jgi:hypothetical protein
MSNTITLIGDVHGKYDSYFDIASTREHTIQLGDFGFIQVWNKLNYSNLDPNKHKIIGGNHDDYDNCVNSGYYLGDFGSYKLNGINFFFVRGGLSIDRVYRVGDELSGGKKTWWSQEELNFDEMYNCLNMYAEVKPDIVFSHAPPQFIVNNLTSHKSGNKLINYKFHEGFCENTSWLGNTMLKKHKPKLWVFGHHHNYFNTIIDGTIYICLPELGTADINLNKSSYSVTTNFDHINF